jgi:hypothetical protein
MGITIAYRGRLADLTRIEDFEDRLLDLALEVGGQAQIWRSSADENPQRMVRGVILNLAPGLESTSLLISPEGWLIGLADIQDAEEGRLTEPPWCFTKTQFGPLEGHVALVEMLTVLRREFFPNLEVSDEGGYWETRDFAELRRRHSQVQQALDLMTAALQRHGLSDEAAEDPEILLRRIERIAAQVHRSLQRPAEHPPVDFPDEDSADPEATEMLWDELFKQNRRQQEALQRALEERRRSGEDEDTAFENALQDLGLEIPGDEPEAPEEPWHAEEPESFPELLDVEATAEESRSADDDLFDAAKDRHPLLECSMNILKDLHSVFQGADPRYAPSLRTLFQGAGDAMGGLAQALSAPEEGIDDYGLRVTQLKRALRGAAFARGALCSLRAAVSADQVEELQRKLAQLEQDIFQELSRVRSEKRAEDG